MLVSYARCHDSSPFVLVYSWFSLTIPIYGWETQKESVQVIQILSPLRTLNPKKFQKSEYYKVGSVAIIE